MKREVSIKMTLIYQVIMIAHVATKAKIIEIPIAKETSSLSKAEILAPHKRR